MYLPRTVRRIPESLLMFALLRGWASKRPFALLSGVRRRDRPKLIGRASRSRAPMRLQTLDQGQDVALGVLEPGALRLAGCRDPVLGLEVRQVVFLEHHAPGPQLGDL